ncbi:MAG: polymer-forming cytoskeletal protein [Hyphomicrobium sp.]
MFNRKPESDYNAYAQVDAARVSTGTSPTAILSPSVYANTADANYSIINEWLVMRGDLESEADILVKGKIYGNVKCKLLIIDSGAYVEGGIEADEVVVRGATKGVMIATKVRLEKSADVDSEIQHQSFSAEEGAKIKGALRYSDEPVRNNVHSLSANGADATH